MANILGRIDTTGRAVKSSKHMVAWASYLFNYEQVGASLGTSDSTKFRSQLSNLLQVTGLVRDSRYHKLMGKSDVIDTCVMHELIAAVVDMGLFNKATGADQESRNRLIDLFRAIGSGEIEELDSNALIQSTISLLHRVSKIDKDKLSYTLKFDLPVISQAIIDALNLGSTAKLSEVLASPESYKPHETFQFQSIVKTVEQSPQKICQQIYGRWKYSVKLIQNIERLKQLQLSFTQQTREREKLEKTLASQEKAHAEVLFQIRKFASNMLTKENTNLPITAKVFQKLEDILTKKYQKDYAEIEPHTKLEHARKLLVKRKLMYRIGSDSYNQLQKEISEIDKALRNYYQSNNELSKTKSEIQQLTYNFDGYITVLPCMEEFFKDPASREALRKLNHGEILEPDEHKIIQKIIEGHKTELNRIIKQLPVTEKSKLDQTELLKSTRDIFTQSSKKNIKKTPDAATRKGMTPSIEFHQMIFEQVSQKDMTMHMEEIAFRYQAEAEPPTKTINDDAQATLTKKLAESEYTHEMHSVMEAGVTECIGDKSLKDLQTHKISKRIQDPKFFDLEIQKVLKRDPSKYNTSWGKQFSEFAGALKEIHSGELEFTDFSAKPSFFNKKQAAFESMYKVICISSALCEIGYEITELHMDEIDSMEAPERIADRYDEVAPYINYLQNELQSNIACVFADVSQISSALGSEKSLEVLSSQKKEFLEIADSFRKYLLPAI